MEQEPITQEQELHWAFEVGVILKGLHAILDMAGGLVFLFFPKAEALTLLHTWMYKELLEDPKDILANFLIHSLESLSLPSQHFFGVYLLLHGMTNVVLAVGLLRGKMWAYPTALVLFSLFVVSQAVRYASTHSTWLLGFMLVDIAVIALVFREYRRAREKRATSVTSV